MGKEIFSSILNGHGDGKLFIFEYHQSEDISHFLNRNTFAQNHPILCFRHTPEHDLMPAHQPSVQHFVDLVVAGPPAIQHLLRDFGDEVFGDGCGLLLLLEVRVGVRVEPLVICNLFGEGIFIQHIHRQQVHNGLLPAYRLVGIN